MTGKWRLSEPMLLCNDKKPGRSTALCEYPAGHLKAGGLQHYADHHFGRTRGGYWKRWLPETLPSNNGPQSAADTDVKQ